MAVRVLVGDIFPVRGHKAALQGAKVIAVGKPCSEQIVMIIGIIGLLGSKDDFTLRPEGIISSSDAVSIEQRIITI